VRVCWFILVGLLAIHPGTSSAGAAGASLPVSATVFSTCAVSSNALGQPGLALGTVRDLARVSCSPAAAYSVSFHPPESDAAAPRAGKARASTLLLQPTGRGDNVPVVEIRY
jgi:hypothetical protein